ncbi:MAG TPA: hypothetical protein VFD92_09740 [Candidatus Binatia bacterium]|nr:hypothetical protein [Candidatus Binatia bacterium]
MLVLADGCRVCVGLDSVDGVFELSAPGDREAVVPGAGGRLPLVTWGELIGVPPPADAAPPSQVMVVRTPAGRVALAAQACLGIREASFGTAPVLATTLADGAGEPRCFVHLIDRRPHFILDPRAIAQALAARDAAPAGAGDAGATPEAAP